MKTAILAAAHDEYEDTDHLSDEGAVFISAESDFFVVLVLHEGVPGLST